MKLLKKFLIFLIIIVGASLYYINQQSTLIKLSYHIDKNKEIINSILDRNNHLMYNNHERKAPQNVEMALTAKNVNFCIPGEDQIVYLTGKKASQEEKIKTARRNIFNIFGINNKAEAKSIH